VLTEAGAKKRAGVWLLTPEAVEAELEHLGPEALGLGSKRLGGILAEQPRRLHSLLRDQRVISGIGRAWANEILHTAQLSPFAPAQGVSAEEVERLAAAIDSERRQGPEGLPRPQPAARALPRLRNADRARRLRGAHDLLLPPVPNGRADAQGPAPVAAAPLGASGRTPGSGLALQHFGAGSATIHPQHRGWGNHGADSIHRRAAIRNRMWHCKT
jgi:ribosomal protein S13